MPRKRFERPKPYLTRRKRFVIATEGKQTEKIYFELFKNDDFRKNVQVCVLSTREGESAPKHVLRRLRRHIHDAGVEEGDELWVVVDVDSWGEEALHELCHECNRSGFRVAVSNPCFELWLLLHQEHPSAPPTVKACKQDLTRLLGQYDKASYNVGTLASYIPHAINHARRLDSDPDAPWPRTTATRVYLLVEKLRA